MSLLVRERFSSGVGRVLKWSVVGFLFLSALVVLASFLLGDLAAALRLAPWVIAVGGLVLLFGRLTGWMQAWQIKRHDPNVVYPFTHTLDSSGFHVSAHTANTDLHWTGMHKVRETANEFMFYYSKRLAYYLPKRAIATQQELDDLRSWIRAQLPASVPFVDSRPAKMTG